MMRITLLLALVLTVLSAGIYQERYDEAYKIAQAMTLDQKIGQMLQVDFQAVGHDHITDEQIAINLHLGSLLVGGNGMPDDNGNLVDLSGNEE